MDETTAGLAAAIGERVRAERQARRWTLDQLAGAAGVSRRMVVNVEQGAANPSVGTLLRLSGALGVGLPALVEPPMAKPVTVTRRGEGPALWTSGGGGRAVLVASAGTPDVLELWDWTLGPEDRHASDAHAPGTTELLHVQQGTVVVEVDGQAVTLGPGDAISYPGDVPHAYANPRKRPARFALTVFEPAAAGASATGGDRHRSAAAPDPS